MKHLITIQKELKANKSQYNSFGKYKYRSAEDILEAVKPLLYKEECILTLSDELVALGWGENQRFYIKATATLRTPDETFTVSAYAREDETKKGMDGSQITGTASSYARKYALNGLFCIDDAKDADTDEHHVVVDKSTRAELLNKVDALMETKGIPVEEITKMAGVNIIGELPNERLEKLVDWLKSQ